MQGLTRSGCQNATSVIEDSPMSISRLVLYALSDIEADPTGTFTIGEGERCINSLHQALLSHESNKSGKLYTVIQV